MSELNRRKRVRVEFIDGSTESFYCDTINEDKLSHYFGKTYARPFGQDDLDRYEQISFERRHVKSVRYKYINGVGNP